ncbi:hypothetical protein BC829DRAFT_412599 [Chytridium lagenaria]|nr:hypothetical protein BC829DRAFT_412599 [Chytridium lagenaria]
MTRLLLSVMALLASATMALATSNGILPSACSIPPHTEECNGHHTVFYYKQDEKICDISYKGCSSKVPFGSIEACRKACQPSRKLLMMQVDGATCLLNPCDQGETCVDEPYRSCFTSPCPKFSCVRSEDL